MTIKMGFPPKLQEGYFVEMWLGVNEGGGGREDGLMEPPDHAWGKCVRQNGALARYFSLHLQTWRNGRLQALGWAYSWAP